MPLNTPGQATLTLGHEAVSRWIPAGEAAGEGAVSFTAGNYTVLKGTYTLRLTDGAATATLAVT